jgi:mannose-6-phosphate isomerase
MVEAFVAWLRRQALPFWLERCADPVSGQFLEKLDFAGAAVADAPLRVRVGFRQVYVLSHAAVLGWLPAEPALAVARRGLERLRSVAWGIGGPPGRLHVVAPDGAVVDGRRDLYDQAFALLGLAWFVNATGDADAEAWIGETLAFIENDLAAAHGGYDESSRRELPRRQNPHMHLLEAFLALAETSGEARYLARAGEIVGLFRTRFYGEEGIVREFFGPAWETGPEWNSDAMEPGHLFEWVWLLRRYARSTGKPVGRLTARLFANGRRGVAGGFAHDGYDPVAAAVTGGRRLWPQTEYLKALLVEMEATGSESLRAEADGLAAALLRTYLADVPPGTWQDSFSADGRANAADIPASTLYHLFAAAAEAARIGIGA